MKIYENKNKFSISITFYKQINHQRTWVQGYDGSIKTRARCSKQPNTSSSRSVGQRFQPTFGATQFWNHPKTGVKQHATLLHGTCLAPYRRKKTWGEFDIHVISNLKTCLFSEFLNFFWNLGIHRHILVTSDTNFMQYCAILMFGLLWIIVTFYGSL